MSEGQEYLDRMKAAGMKATKSRIAILDIMLESEQPLSAEEIYHELREKKVDTNLSTVYRTLDSLENKDIITKISLMDEEKRLYEYNELVHKHYLVCISCKKIVAIKNCPLADYEKRLEEETNFNILGHKLYLYGYCEACQKADAKNHKK